jgi:hypothetical protein
MRRFPVAALRVACVLFAGILFRAEAQMPPMPSAFPPEEGDVPVGVVAVPAGEGEVRDTLKQRDPFWPVGYTPKKVVKPKEKGPGRNPALTPAPVPELVRLPVWDEARKKLDIRGISLIHDKNSKAPKYLAMIAGKLVEIGDTVAVKYDERMYRWRVVGISDEGVSLQKMDVRGE